MGIDVGATYIRAGLFTSSGELLKKTRIRFPSSGVEEALAGLVRDLVLGVEEDLGGVGVGSIGPLDLSRGSVVNAVNAPVRSFRIVEPLSLFKVPVVLANDAVAAAWGEYVLGLGRGRENLLYVTISTGLGGGVVVDGNLLIGKDGNAHEIGHLVVDFSTDLRCGCGGYGHWEGIASGANMPRSFEHYVRRRGLCPSPGSVLCDLLSRGSPLSAVEIFEHYYRGDPVAVSYIDDYIALINSAGLASAINAYDPEIVILGGSVALNNRDPIMRGIERNLERYLIVRRPEIVFTGFGDDVGIYGAAALAVKPPKSLEKHVEAWSRISSWPR